MCLGVGVCPARPVTEAHLPRYLLIGLTGACDGYSYGSFLPARTYIYLPLLTFRYDVTRRCIVGAYREMPPKVRISGSPVIPTRGPLSDDASICLLKGDRVSISCLTSFTLLPSGSSPEMKIS